MAKSKMTIGQYALGLVSVGVLFFVIGYSFEKGKDRACTAITFVSNEDWLKTSLDNHSETVI